MPMMRIKKIPVEISARHIHLSKRHLGVLFGRGYQLKKLKDLTQPGDFAAEETLDIKSKNMRLNKVRVVGPIRKETQVELSLTDAINLGMNPPVRISGNIKKTPTITLISKKNKIAIKDGVIIPQRHVHCNPKEAKKFKLKNGMLVSIKISGKRGIVFNNIKVRVADNYRLCLHLNTDEGNAAGINKKGEGFLIF